MSTMYILKWTNGDYVVRDNSTGPMSTGGYPLKTIDINEATRWDSPQGAADYANICRWNGMIRAVFELSLVEGRQIEVPEKWTECDRNCIWTPESTKADAKHYLDCPVWKQLLKNDHR